MYEYRLLELAKSRKVQNVRLYGAFQDLRRIITHPRALYDEDWGKEFVLQQSL
jgi:hypothetical protein